MISDVEVVKDIVRGRDITKKENVDAITAEVLKLPQAPAPVEHFFGPGVYIRQVKFCAGTFAVGHYQRNEHLNYFVCGTARMLQPDGSVKEMSGPRVFTSPPGQKMGYIVEDVVWQNIYANPDNERDIEKLEERHLRLDLAIVKEEHDTKLIEQGRPWVEAANLDYISAIESLGYSEDDVQEEMARLGMAYDLPQEFSSRIAVRNSRIHGKGLFASTPFRAGALIGPASMGGGRTIIGRYTNHSHAPNGEFILAGNGDILLVARTDINGCHGGGPGDEITIDYRNAFALREGRL